MTQKEERLAETSTRRMPAYRGSAEARPQPRSTKSDTGSEPEKMQRVLKYHAANRMKIGEHTFMVPEDKGYDEWKPRDGHEWTGDDLPINHHKLKSVSGILLDLKKIKDKLSLSAAVPEFVMQMLVQAVNDYKKLLETPMKVIRAAAVDYAKYLRSSEQYEGEQMTAEDLRLFESDVGLAALVTTNEFTKFFDGWKLVGYTPPEGGQQYIAPANILRLFQRMQIEDSRLRSALNIVKKLGTFDVNDQSISKMDLTKELRLNSKAVFPLTKVDACLIHDPYFRYYVDGAGGGSGSRVYYWDWVRNHADAIGKYASQF